MELKRSVGVRLGTVGELLALLVANKRWWLVPMVLIWMGAALLLMALHAAEYVAPFVYSIF